VPLGRESASRRGPGPRAATSVVVASVGLVYAGQIFSLNGAQWDWWRWACFAGIAVLVSLVLLHRRLQAVAKRLSRLGLSVVSFSGVVLLAGALAVMSIRFSDPYSGPLLWPRTLAVLALLGFVVAGVALSALTGRS
jgi:hypothetical protein